MRLTSQATSQTPEHSGVNNRTLNEVVKGQVLLSSLLLLNTTKQSRRSDLLSASSMQCHPLHPGKRKGKRLFSGLLSPDDDQTLSRDKQHLLLGTEENDIPISSLTEGPVNDE
ncbi:Uncharacterized protein DAT39_018968 [Clarias magur]|uniref:Uncharacterized protein n=1 Tax=Clarias magur TaxID=1594786 RepID=A0A8J4T849_CLAMG|nr:Uncharacterized protein DAT39_018968 [Clarias magur]